MSITHAFVSAKSDGADASVVRPSDWNAAHVGMGLANKGAWSSSTAYVVGDVVSSSGTWYVCLVAHTNHTPPNATYWGTLPLTVFSTLEAAKQITVPLGAYNDLPIQFAGYQTGIYASASALIFVINWYARAILSANGIAAAGFGISNATDPLAGGLALDSTGLVVWQSTYPTKDLAIGRGAAGTLYVGNGTGGDSSGGLKCGDLTPGGFYPRRLSQADVPAAGTGATQLDTGELCIWHDTDDSKCYLCFNDGGTVKKVELT